MKLSPEIDEAIDKACELIVDYWNGKKTLAQVRRSKYGKVVLEWLSS